MGRACAGQRFSVRMPGLRVDRFRVQINVQLILRQYLRHYGDERPHRGLSLETPEPRVAQNQGDGVVVRVDRLGGLIHEYHR